MPRRPARAWGSVDRGKHRRAIELRKHHIPGVDTVMSARRQHGQVRDCKCLAIPAESENLACVDTHCTGIGIPREGVCMEIEASISEATGKVESHTPVVGSPEESDGVIVPGKLANNGIVSPRSQWREAPPAERKSTSAARFRSQSRSSLSNGNRWLRRRHTKGWLQTNIPADCVSTRSRSRMR